MKKLPYKSGDVVQLLWTGGFDSTCLLILLLEAGANVHPVYIDQGGIKAKAEKEVQRLIRESLWVSFGKKVYDTRFFEWNLAPGTHSVESFPPKVSWQYPWLLACAPTLLGKEDRPIELGVVSGDGQGVAGHINAILNAYNGYLKELGFQSAVRASFADKTKKQLMNAVPSVYHLLLEKTWTCEQPIQSGSIITSCGGEDCALCKDRIVRSWSVKISLEDKKNKDDLHKAIENDLCKSHI